MADDQKLRSIVLSITGQAYGPFDTLQEVREFVTRKWPDQQQDEGDYSLTLPTGWRVVSLWKQD